MNEWMNENIAHLKSSFFIYWTKNNLISRCGGAGVARCYSRASPSTVWTVLNWGYSKEFWVSAAEKKEYLSHLITNPIKNNPLCLWSSSNDQFYLCLASIFQTDSLSLNHKTAHFCSNQTFGGCRWPAAAVMLVKCQRLKMQALTLERRTNR